MIVIGHRGACGYEPENTLRSFGKAIRLGVDMIEMDIRLSLDDVPVVIHDANLRRTTDGTGYVYAKTLSELKELDAGKNEKIPTLEETLNMLPKDMMINLELKVEGALKPVVDVIGKSGFPQGNILISSFFLGEIEKYKQALPDIRTGYLYFGIPLQLAREAAERKAYSIHLSSEFINKEMIDNAHRLGLKVFAYTIEAEDDVKRMRQLGVDGIFSDYPDKA